MVRYRSKRSYSWTPEIAYLTGMMAADGCLVNDNRHLNVTSKDYEVIETVQSILKMNVKVGIKISGFGTEAYNLQFSNVALYDFLVGVGLSPAKSKTIGRLNVPAEFYADFLRGHFDGDGTVYGYWDKRWRSSLMYYTGYISASPVFLDWIRIMNLELAQTTPGKIKPGRGAQALTYAKADSQKLFSFMYYHDELPMLTRKYTKFIAFLRADPYPSKELRARVL
jgi:hypothetical protein